MILPQDIYTAIRRADRELIQNREALEHHQRRKLKILFQKIAPKSSFYRHYIEAASSIPISNASILKSHFSEICTLPIRYQEVLASGFRSHIRNYYVTNNLYSLWRPKSFNLLDENERLRKIGHSLYTLLDGLPIEKGQRIAHFHYYPTLLQSMPKMPNNWQYQTYDLFSNHQALYQKLKQYQPDIIIAPAQVLFELANCIEKKIIPPFHSAKIYAVNAMLTSKSRAYLQSYFPTLKEALVHNGNLIATSCHHGQLHLCEKYYFFEQHWVDDNRFILRYTDFYAYSLPRIRYQLNGIFLSSQQNCPCGSPMLNLSGLESHVEDVFWLPDQHQQFHPIFTDTLRKYAESLFSTSHYHIRQTHLDRIEFYADNNNSIFADNEDKFNELLDALGIDSTAVSYYYRPLKSATIQTDTNQISRANFPLPNNCHFL